MKKKALHFQFLALAWLTAAVGLGAGCATVSPQGVIELGGWALPKGKVAGYNIYIAEAGSKKPKFEKVNEYPVTGKTIQINQLEAGRDYYLYMTMISNDDPPKESRPGKTFTRKAKPETTPTP